MFYLTLTFFIIFNVIFIYLLRSVLAERILQIEKVLEERDKYYVTLRETEQRITSQNIKLEAKAANIFVLYEITKEITRSLKKDELFSFFKDKLREYMHFEDCRLLDNEKDLEGFTVDYSSFPLLAEKSLLGYLAIKGISQEDEDRFSILVKQLALGLRRAKLYERIEELAITDSLTGVYTRRYCLERFREEFQRAEKYNLRLSFLMIDIDHFKKYNDKYGHLVGDTVLKEVAKIIKLYIREIDLLGRFGGEEFALILPDTSKDGASFAAERIRQQIEKQQIKAYDELLKVTISIGVATLPTDAKGYEELIDKSDWALYRAKKIGRNRVCAFGVFK